ncbi:hypothetical protein KC365_g4550 [Hortaea werneckii]|nr:hypothetical protein KC342_g3674 [Hortaea werneckii]KAI7103419.1 hypothetical protein KC339_g5272 [Hortaea werneckii]KAI7238042.1 hypothetical protein KC365_g4550 [Hortaea werneckii]
MPPRVSRSSLKSAAAPKNVKNKSRKRNLDAYATASHQLSNNSKRRRGRESAPHRLGESLDDNPRQKRRRTEDHDEDDDDASEDDSAPRRKMPSSKGRGLEEDGEVEWGSDSEGNEWRMGDVGSDEDDSDLDSEEAFGDSDEERFEGFTFRGSQSNKKKPPQRKRKVQDEDEEMGEGVDLDEGGDGGSEEEDDFGDEGVDLATMLDDEDEENLGGKDKTGEDEESASDEDDDDESGSEASDEDDEDEGKDGDNEERMARLRDRIEALDGKQSTSTPSAPSADGGALSVDDLLADLDPSAQKQYAAALKTKKKSQAPKTLSAPLPKRQQDKINREVASQKAKEQLDRWRDTVINNRRAEFLSFPLQDPNATKPQGQEKFDTQGAPQNDLEANIQRIMEESGMASKPGQQGGEDNEGLGEGEEGIMKAEELGTNKLPVEEVMRRRQELRRARELLFREEIKAKRINKIKSKAYRRVHRKERERNAEKERALLDPEGLGLAQDEDEREKMDRRRAEERMSTKHRDSKWAKQLKATNRTVWDEGARDSVHDQARRQEELRRRIAGQDVNSDEGSDVPSDDDDDDDGSAAGDGAQTLRQLKKLNDDGQAAGKQKGVGNMKFMRDAEARQRAQNDDDVDRLRKELALEDGDGASESEKGEEEGLGRAIFGPKAKEGKAPQPKAKKPELEEGDLSGDEDETVTHSEEARPATTEVGKKQTQQSKGNVKKSRDSASGPLAKAAAVPDRRDKRAQAQSQEKPATTSSWLDDEGPKKSRKDRRREREAAGTGVIITNDDKPAAAPSKTTTQSNKSATKSTANGQDSEDDNDGSDNENPLLTKEQQKSDFHRRAFAGDDVQAAFNAEKEEDVASEDEKEISTHLPGWGSWTGTGLSRSIQKANEKQQHNPLFKHKLPGGVRPEQRKDARLPNVIISEKKDRKGGKYQAPMLPHGFEQKEQYERSLRVPVGPEWTTKETFQRATRPRVVVKPGAVIQPMEKPMA